jgi:thioredoxin-related protein
MAAKRNPRSLQRALALVLFVSAAAALSPAQTLPDVQKNAVRSPGNAQWAPTVEEAGKRAAREGKFLFVEFDQQGCGHCQRMDILLYPAFDFEALLIPMVPVKVLLESTEGKEMARRHGIKEAPAILILSPEGRMVFLMEGFTTAEDFYQHARQELDIYKAFARRVEGQDVARLSAREAFDTARELYLRGDPSAALPRLKRAVASPDASVVLREDARELLAAVEFDGGDTASSRQTIQRLITTTKDAKRRERAELFRAQIPLAENKPDEAYALFKKFEKDHPKSAYLPQVRAFAARLASGGAPPKQ